MRDFYFLIISLISNFYFIFAPYLFQHLSVDNVTLNNNSNNKNKDVLFIVLLFRPQNVSSFLSSSHSTTLNYVHFG